MFRQKETATVTAVVIPDKITKRVQALSTGALNEYIETHVSEVGKYTRQYSSSGEAAYIEEALTNAQVVLAIVTELKNRAG